MSKQSKGERASSMRTSDTHSPFVSGNLADTRDAHGRVQKLFVSSCDTKRLNSVKPVPRWHGQVWRDDAGWHKDSVEELGGLVANRKAA